MTSELSPRPSTNTQHIEQTIHKKFEYSSECHHEPLVIGDETILNGPSSFNIRLETCDCEKEIAIWINYEKVVLNTIDDLILYKNTPGMIDFCKMYVKEGMIKYGFKMQTKDGVEILSLLNSLTIEKQEKLPNVGHAVLALKEDEEEKITPIETIDPMKRKFKIPLPNQKTTSLPEFIIRNLNSVKKNLENVTITSDDVTPIIDKAAEHFLACGVCHLDIGELYLIKVIILCQRQFNLYKFVSEYRSDHSIIKSVMFQPFD